MTAEKLLKGVEGDNCGDPEVVQMDVIDRVPYARFNKENAQAGRNNTGKMKFICMKNYIENKIKFLEENLSVFLTT
jgi:hypothetical protein